MKGDGFEVIQELVQHWKSQRQITMDVKESASPRLAVASGPVSDTDCLRRLTKDTTRNAKKKKTLSREGAACESSLRLRALSPAVAYACRLRTGRVGFYE